MLQMTFWRVRWFVASPGCPTIRAIYRAHAYVSVAIRAIDSQWCSFRISIVRKCIVRKDSISGFFKWVRTFWEAFLEITNSFRYCDWPSYSHGSHKFLDVNRRWILNVSCMTVLCHLATCSRIEIPHCITFLRRLVGDSTFVIAFEGKHNGGNSA